MTDSCAAIEEPICQRIRLRELAAEVLGSEVISREITSKIGAEVVVDEFQAIVRIDYQINVCGVKSSPLANIHVVYELDYRRVSDVEPAEPSEVEQIFIDSQSSVNALVRERVLSLSHAMGIRPIVYQPPSRHELTEAARAFALSRDDDDDSMASDEFAIDVADEKRAEE